MVLVGEPGIGKGQVIKSIEEILRFHKFESANVKKYPTKEQNDLAALVRSQDMEAAMELESKMTTGNLKVSIDKPLLVPIAANAITFEALVQHMSQSMRRCEYTNKEGKLKIYSHSSLCFCLEELGSLLRNNKNTKDIVQFLHEAYDCNEQYEYDTKTQGKNRIKRVCLNLMAGTTPDFMRETFDDGILNQGFSSRSFFIYAERNRKSVFFIPELTDKQRVARERIISHVKGLTDLYGQIQIDPRTVEYLESWWEGYCKDVSKHASQSRKLKAYKARKNIHVMKVAMAEHFGESYDMFIPLKRFEESVDFLHEEEKTMHRALETENSNPLAASTLYVAEYIKRAGRATFNELLVEFWGRVRKPELEEVLNYLQTTSQIGCKQEADKDTGKIEVFYVSKS
jgi:hypothetical protein